MTTTQWRHKKWKEILRRKCMPLLWAKPKCPFYKRYSETGSKKVFFFFFFLILVGKPYLPILGFVLVLLFRSRSTRVCPQSMAISKAVYPRALAISVSACFLISSWQTVTRPWAAATIRGVQPVSPRHALMSAPLSNRKLTIRSCPRRAPRCSGGSALAWPRRWWPRCSGACPFTSAPASSNTSTTATWPSSAATESEDAPSELQACTEALFCTSSLTADRWPCRLASISAVLPSRFLASTAAPRFNSERSTCSWPPEAASMSGVCPSWSRTSTFGGWTATLSRSFVTALALPSDEQRKSRSAFDSLPIASAHTTRTRPCGAR